jgi:hypothetical protein
VSLSRKKPLVVRAVQFDPHLHPWPEGVIPWSNEQRWDAASRYVLGLYRHAGGQKKRHRWRLDYYCRGRQQAPSSRHPVPGYPGDGGEVKRICAWKSI